MLSNILYNARAHWKLIKKGRSGRKRTEKAKGLCGPKIGVFFYEYGSLSLSLLFNDVVFHMI